ncbi:MAG: Cna B-type domain-containing protein [Hornefia sp.]|nr:Cna B-type domain-containing protein [Hornefia sp.]
MNRIKQKIHNKSIASIFIIALLIAGLMPFPDLFGSASEAHSAAEKTQEKQVQPAQPYKRAYKARKRQIRDNDTTAFKVIKKWSDGEEKHDNDSIKVTLLQDGVEYKNATVNKASNWSYTFGSLPVRDSSGRTYKYEIKEQNFEGYDTEYGKVKSVGGGSSTGSAVYDLIDFKDIKSDDEIVMVLTKGSRSRIVNAKHSGNNSAFNEIDCRTEAKFDTDDHGRYTLLNGSEATSTWKINVSEDNKFTALNNTSKLYIDASLKGKKYTDSSTVMKYNDDYWYGEYEVAKFANESKKPYITLYDGKRLDRSQYANTRLTFYRKDTSGASMPPKMYLQTITNDKVNIKKQIDALEDNEGINKNPDTNIKGKDDYRLYLDVSGGVRENPIDVLLVVDNTHSMKDNQFKYKGSYHTRDWVANELVNGTGSTASGQSKADGLVSEIMKLNPKNKVGVMTFCGPEKGSGTTYWPEDMNRFTKEIMGWKNLNQTGGIVPYVDVKYKTGTGTNYMSALLRADDYFAQNEVANDGNDKYMIFISDGEPNDYMEELGNGRYRYSRGGYNKNLPFYRDFFVANNPDVKTFTVGIKKESEEYQILSDIGGGHWKNGGSYYPANTGDELAEAFKNIKESLYPADVKITDELSKYVDLNLTNPDLKVIRTYKNSSGQERKEIVWEHTGSISSSGGSVGHKPYGSAEDCVDSVRYTPSNSGDSTGKIELKFKAGYKIGNDNRFAISYNVKVNNKAKETLKRSYGKYPDKGDYDTDFGTNKTSSKKPGFFSNKNAYVEYKTANGESRKKKYMKPVVQSTLDIGFVKKDKADENIKIGGAKFKLFKAAASADLPISGWVKGVQVDGEVTTASDGRLSFENIKEGRYILEETEAAPGYQLKSDAKWYISYDGSNGLSVYDAKGDKFDASNAFPNNTVADYSYCITNSKPYELPKAGGMGTYAFYLIGGFFVMASFMILKRMKNES